MTEEDIAVWSRSVEDPTMAKPRRPRKPQKPRTRPNAHLEDDLSCAVNKLFCAIFDPEKVVFYAVPNGGRRDATEAVRLKAQGVRRGVYDWHLHWNGPIDYTKVVGPCTGVLELKVGKNDRSDEQKVFGRRMRIIGHYADVCWSLDEVIGAIAEWGVPHRRIT